MPRSRLVLFVWAFGMFTLLGAWGHSLRYKSFLRYDKPRAGVRRSIAIVGGSVEILRVPISGRGKNVIQVFSLRLRKGYVPPPIPTYKLGRFRHTRTGVEIAGRPDTLHTLEFPIWILFLPWTLFCLPFYRRLRRVERSPPPEPG